MLSCPAGHPESYLVCAPSQMDGRRVLRGGLGCPVCGAEYPILDGVAWFAPPGRPEVRHGAAAALTAEALRTFWDLKGGGGYALLVGSAARLGPETAALHPGVHCFAVNPPAGVAPSPELSLLFSPARLPVKAASLRAVAVGSDHACEPWLTDAGRVLLKGLRYVAEGDAELPPAVALLARGAGVVVGEKRPA